MRLGTARGFTPLLRREPVAAKPKRPGGNPPGRGENQELITVAPATAAAAAEFTPTAAAATRAFFAGASDIDGQGATRQFLAVEGVNRFLRLFGGAHGNEAETARPASRTVHHQVRFDNRPMC